MLSNFSTSFVILCTTMHFRAIKSSMFTKNGQICITLFNYIVSYFRVFGKLPTHEKGNSKEKSLRCWILVPGPSLSYFLDFRLAGSAISQSQQYKVRKWFSIVILMQYYQSEEFHNKSQWNFHKIKGNIQVNYNGLLDD